MSKAVRVVTGSGATQEAMRETDAASARLSMVALLSEQAHHAMQATIAVGCSRTAAEVARAQSDFIWGSFQRLGQFSERYLAFVSGGLPSALFPSSRR